MKNETTRITAAETQRRQATADRRTAAIERRDNYILQADDARVRAIWAAVGK